MKKKYAMPSILILVFSLAGILHHQQWITGDVSWLLDLTQRMFHGGQYVRDYLEVNPPLILYIYSLPVWLSHYISLPDYTLVRFEGYLIALFSLGFSYHLIQLVFTKDDKGFAQFFVVILSIIYLIVPANQFSQRENILFMLSMPYLILMSLRFKKHTMSNFACYAAGVFAGVGFSIKPYYLLMPLILELFLQRRMKGGVKLFRPENLTIMFMVLLYLLSIYCYFPSYFTMLFNYTLPYYKHLGAMPYSKLLSYGPVILFFSMVLISFLLKKTQTYPEVILVYGVAAAISFVVFLFPRQLWYYHIIPMFGYTMILLLLHSFTLYRNKWHHKLPFTFNEFSSLLFITIGVTYVFSFVIITYTRSIYLKIDQNGTTNRFIHYFKKNNIQNAYIFSNHMGLVVALDYARVKNTGRFLNQLFIPYIVKTAHADNPSVKTQYNLQRAVTDYHRFVVEDLTRHHPEVIIIKNPSKHDVYPYTAPFHFAFLNFLNKDVRFKLIWQAYRFDKNINGIQIYKLKSLSLRKVKRSI